MNTYNDISCYWTDKPPSHTTPLQIFLWIISPQILRIVTYRFLLMRFYSVYPCMSLSPEVFPVPLGIISLLFIHMYIHTLLILYLGHISYAHTAAPNRSPYVQKFHIYLLCMCLLKDIPFTTWAYQFTTVSIYTCSEKW